MSAREDAMTSLVNGGYAPQIAREILAGVVAEARAEEQRRWAARIREVGGAKGWSTWAAAYMDPDVEFVDTGMPPTETIVAELRRLDRVAVFREGARALRDASGSYGSPGYDYELGPGLADGANRLDAMADAAEKDTSGGRQPSEGESTPDLADFEAVISTSDGSYGVADEYRCRKCGAIGAQGTDPKTLADLASMAQRHECLPRVEDGALARATDPDGARQ